MPTFEIQDLPLASAPDGSEWMPVQQGGITRRLPSGDVGERLPGTVLYAKDYGAVGDAVAGHSGTSVATDATFTDTLATFTGSAGKTILINGAGAAGATLVTTIASVNSATSVELTVAPSTSIAGTATYFYGTDDTVAINNAVTATRDLAQTLGRALLRFEAAGYLIGANPSVGAGGTNAQIPVPNGTVDDACWIELAGVPGGGIQHWVSVDRLSTPVGTVWYSAIATKAWNSGEGLASVIGGPASFKTQSRSYVNLAMTDIRIVQADQAQLTDIDCGFLMSMKLTRVQCATLAATAVDSAGFATDEPPLPTNTQSFGVVTPTVNNWNPTSLDEVGVAGRYCAYAMGELAHCGTLHAAWCRLLLAPLSSYHTSHITQLIDVNNLHGIGYNTPGTGIVAAVDSNSWDTTSGTPPAITGPILIEHWMIQHGPEDVGDLYVRVADVHDANNKLQGHAWFTLVQAGYSGVNGGIENQTFIRTSNGGSYMRCWDVYQRPGGVTAPSAPASGVARQNPFNRDCQVLLTATSVSQVAVSGATFVPTAAAVVGPFTVQSGRAITPTYTGTLTWVWNAL